MKTRKGGQKVRTQHINGLSKQVCQNKFDCCAEVFYALGYINLPDSIYLATIRPLGLLSEESLALLKEAYGPSIRQEPLTSDMVINDNEATISVISWTSPSESGSHYFIMYKTNDKIVYAFDPQLGLNLNFIEYLKPYQRIKDVAITLSYINSDDVMEVALHRITRDIIDRVLNHSVAPYREPTEDHDLSLPSAEFGFDEDWSQYGELTEDPSMY